MVENQKEQHSNSENSVIFNKLIVSDNSLLNIVNWLKDDNYIIIHSIYESARFFHKCEKLKDVDEYIKTHRFIYINLSKTIRGLLDDGEWNWHIKNAGFDECTCEIKNKALNSDFVKYKCIFEIQ